MVAAEGDFGSESNFLEKLSLAADGGDAQVGATKIDSNGKVSHVRKRLSELRGSVLIVERQLLIDD